MALPDIRTDMMDFCGYSHEATPLYFDAWQEMSTQADGTSYAKDLGPGRWFGDFLTEPLSHNRAAEFQAIIESLDGIIGRFEACDLRKQYPAAYPTGAFADTGLINSVINPVTMTLKSLPAGFVLTRGDHFAFDYTIGSDTFRALHRVMETVVASGAGLTPAFVIRPQLRMGYALNTPVKLKRPMGVFRLVAKSFVPAMKNSTSTAYSFKAVQAL